eukprot:8593992-Pyramimonas_sp.AAC.1
MYRLIRITSLWPFRLQSSGFHGAPRDDAADHFDALVPGTRQPPRPSMLKSTRVPHDNLAVLAPPAR